MARPRTQAQRRKDLVTAALDSAATLGLRSLSMTDVAAQAGLTRGAVLYYYEDLDALLTETHQAGIQRFCDHRDALVRSLDSPREQLGVAIRAGLPSGPDDALMRLLYEFDVLAGRSSLHDELVESMYARQLGIYRDILDAGTTSGDFSPTIAAESLAMNLVALEDAYGLHIVAGNSQITVDTAEAAMRDVSAGLGAAPAPPGASKEPTR